jgi:hypothetical protein
MGNLRGIREWQKEEGTERRKVGFMEREGREGRSRFYGEGK